MDPREASETATGNRKASAPRSRGGWRAAAAGAALAAILPLAPTGHAEAAPIARSGIAQAEPGTAAQAPQQAALDPARLVAQQIARERAGDPTALLSRSFKAAYDAVPRDQDNIGFTLLDGGYDVPDKVVKVSDLKSDDASSPRRATATVTLHATNEDAPKPSFNRTVVVAFVQEDGQWRIDDVRSIDRETAAQRQAGWEIWLKRGLRSLSDPRVMPAGVRQDPACALPAPDGSAADPQAAAAGFTALSDIGIHEMDPYRETIAERFVKAIGSACPFQYQLVDLTGDGLSDLVLQLSDRKLGATDAGLWRTAVYALDRQGKWQPVIDGLSRSVLVRKDRSGDPQVAMAGNAGEGYKAWRWAGTAFVPEQSGGR